MLHIDTSDLVLDPDPSVEQIMLRNVYVGELPVPAADTQIPDTRIMLRSSAAARAALDLDVLAIGRALRARADGRDPAPWIALSERAVRQLRALEA